MEQTKERATASVAARPSTYETLLVHAEAGLASSNRVEVAARLARELDAHVIGLGAEAFDPMPVTDPYLGISTAEWLPLIQEQVDKSLKVAEAEFRRDAAGADLEWVAVQDYPSRAVIGAARAADLVIVGPKNQAPATRHADPAEIVMAAGRPVLVVPEGRNHLRAQSVVVAWKDTRECRRAIADAMPFLRRAETVAVVAVTGKADQDAVKAQVDDVVAYLKRDGVRASATVTTAAPDGVTLELERIAMLRGADLIVAGAYGHNRMREWVFGGVTEDFLHHPACFVLLSH